MVCQSAEGASYRVTMRENEIASGDNQQEYSSYMIKIKYNMVAMECHIDLWCT